MGESGGGAGEPGRRARRGRHRSRTSYRAGEGRPRVGPGPGLREQVRGRAGSRPRRPAAERSRGAPRPGAGPGPVATSPLVVGRRGGPDPGCSPVSAGNFASARNNIDAGKDSPFKRREKRAKQPNSASVRRARSAGRVRSALPRAAAAGRE